MSPLGAKVLGREALAASVLSQPRSLFALRLAAAICKT